MSTLLRIANLRKEDEFIKNTSLLVGGLLKKSKTKPRELILKVDNIILLWRSAVPNMYQNHALNLAMTIESSNVERKSCEL